MLLCAIMFLVILLFCPSLALEGSKYGVTLWLTELLPTLLPFFIAIRLFQQGLPQIASRRGALLLGLLCGYPTGAALVSYQYENGVLPRHKAYLYLGFVNNPSPMFILSFCGNYILHLSYSESVVLLSVTALSNFAGSLLFSFFYSRVCNKPDFPIASPKRTSPETSPASVSPPSAPERKHNFSQSMDECILQSFILITKVGGYVILFSILGQILRQYLSVNRVSGILSLGALEITSGVSYLKQAALSHTTKEVLTAALLSFGGFSAIAQTNSVLTSSGLSILPYVLNKLLNALLACGASLLLLGIF